jgi:hypothetical protein
MAAPSEEKLICDQFNLEALTVNQLKVSKLWQTGKMFSLEPKREVANRCSLAKGYDAGPPSLHPWQI